MPCHIRSASPHRKGRFSSLLPRPSRVVAVLNLESEVEKEVNSAFFRMHTGRWPLFRCHGMRRVGDALIELAEWHPTRIPLKRARYSCAFHPS